MTTLSLTSDVVTDRITCARCGTELRVLALACPACGALTHADRLKDLAASATTATESGELVTARACWASALELLPTASPQHAAVVDRIAALSRQIENGSGEQAGPRSGGAWWRRAGAIGIGGAALFIGKLKFLLLGLTKLSTFASMFAFFGVYWSIYGWPLALGLVASIYVHEMGHVAMLRRLGIASGAPLFIPGFGAVVMLKQHVTDPATDARIGLAGPRWGLAAALGALGAFVVTRQATWLAIGQVTGFINLFNLLPVWQLDGARGFHALDRRQRWAVVAAMAVAFAVSRQRLVLVLMAVAIYRAWQRDAGPGDRHAFATFVVLVLSLSLIARGL